MKKKKRLLSLMLCGAILFSLCGPLASAEAGASADGASAGVSGSDAASLNAEEQKPEDCTPVCSEESGPAAEELDCDSGETESVPAKKKAGKTSAGVYEKKLYRDNAWSGGAPDPGKLLQGGETVSFKDQLIIQYLFALSEEAIRKIDEKADKVYPLTCPAGLKWRDGADTDISFTAEDGNQKTKFATLKRTGGTASLIFEGNLQEKAEGGIDNIYLYLGCRLDENVLGPPQEPATWPIILSDETTIHINIEENQARDSALDGKTGTYANGIFTWAVAYRPGKKEQNLPLSFVDEFDSTYHDYKEGSLRMVKKDGTEISPDNVVKETAGAKTKITCPIPEDLSGGTDPVTITYRTALTDRGFTAVKGQTVTNSAWLTDSRDGQVGNKVSGKATFQKTEWLQKISDGGLKYEPDGRRYLSWKVTVKTNGKKLGKLVLHDTLLSGPGTEYAELDPGSITVTAYRGSASAVETGSHSIQNHDSDVGYDLTFNTRDADQYVITYKTHIREEYFEKSVNGRFQNQAVLEYGWYPDGESGTMFEPEPPKVTVPVDVNGNLIGKSGAGYDPATHQITWRVTVNPHQLNLQSITATDELKKFGQTYVDGSFAVEGNEVTATSVSENAAGILTAAFSGTGTKTFSYIFKTTVDAPEDYGYNLLKKDYHNEVKATATLADGTGSPLAAKAAAVQSIHSNVLQKKAEGYDYSDHTIGWCVTVNENQMPMQSENGVLLEDLLPAGLAYVDGSLTVARVGADGSEESAGAGSYTWHTADTDGGQKLAFNYNGGSRFTDKLLLRFRTKADVDKISDFQEKTDVSISNSAVLKRRDYEELSVKAEQKIANKILDKQGSYNKSQGTISYTVRLNPNGITLSGITVRDDLPQGLQLDRDTVRLYGAAVDAQGGFQKGSEISLDDILTANVLEGWFEIRLPDGNRAYMLEYVTDVTDITQTAFHNKISMSGTASAMPPSGGSDVGVGSGGGGGGGTASPKVNLTLRLQDALRPGVDLEGAVFRIYDGDEPLNEVMTDKDGKAVFRYLKRGKTYRVVEITPPRGHKPMETPVTINISDDKNITPKEYEYPAIASMPVTGTLSFTKKNDAGRPLEGASFVLTDKTPGSNFAKNAASGADGTVSFADVPYGTYELRETKAPAYHESDNTAYQAVVDEAGNAMLADPENPETPLAEIVNRAQKGTVAITKTDKEKGTALPGVAFRLYEWDSGKGERGGVFTTGTTDGNGQMSLEVNLGETYELVEAKSLPGYGTAFEVADPADGITKTEDGVLVTVCETDRPLALKLTNEANTADVVFRLFNASGIPLAGTKVLLCELDDAGTPTGRQIEAEAAADGTVVFRNARRGTKYSVRQLLGGAEEIMAVEVPAGEGESLTAILPDGQTVPLTEDYRATGTIPEEEQWALTANKIDGGTGAPLQGAVFGLYADENCMVFIKNAASGRDGTVTFEGLLKGRKYWLREDAAPRGYNLDSTPYPVEEADPSATVENIKKPDESDSGSGSGSDSGGTEPPESASPTEPEPPKPASPTEPKPTEQVSPSEPEPTEQVSPSEPEPTEQVSPTDPKPSDPTKPAARSKTGAGSPQTGDSTDLALPLTLLCLSQIVFAGASVYHFKKKKYSR